MTTQTQDKIIQELGVKPTIDVGFEIQSRIHFLSDYIRKSGARGLVLGISGGQDSLLAGFIAQRAIYDLRNNNYSASFIAVRLPYIRQADAADAQLAINWLCPDKVYDINLHYGVEGIQHELNTSKVTLNDYHKGNIKARLRATIQYALAGQHNMLVVGTDHAAEAVTGFFTKFGDGAADILPLSGLSKRQGRSMLQHLGAPSVFTTKAPTADLLDGNPGQADESELGITYDLLDDYLEGKDVEASIAQRIEARYAATEHKRQGPVSPTDTWWKS